MDYLYTTLKVNPKGVFHGEKPKSGFLNPKTVFTIILYDKKNYALNRFIRSNLNRIPGFYGSEKKDINSMASGLPVKTPRSHRFSQPPPWLLNNIHEVGEYNIPQYSSRARRSSLLVQLSSCFLHFENKRRLELEIRRFWVWKEKQYGQEK